MSEGPDRGRTLRVALAGGVALVLVGGAVWLRAAARSACHVTAPLLNGVDLVEYGLAGLAFVATAVVLVEVGGGGWWVVPAAAVVALVAAWALLVRTTPPDDHPNTVASCTHNTPAWWPSALPG